MDGALEDGREPKLRLKESLLEAEFALFDRPLPPSAGTAKSVGGLIGVGGAEMTGKGRTDGAVSIFCVAIETLSERSRSWIDDAREDARERPKEDLLALRTTLFKRPVHLGFEVPLLMVERGNIGSQES